MNRRTITTRTDNATMTKPTFNTLTPIRRRRALRAIRSLIGKSIHFFRRRVLASPACRLSQTRRRVKRCVYNVATLV
jgi:hypothetical protein